MAWLDAGLSESEYPTALKASGWVAGFVSALSRFGSGSECPMALKASG